MLLTLWVIICVICVISVIVFSENSNSLNLKEFKKKRSFFDENEVIEEYEVIQETDQNYGADADGNRGISISYIDAIYAQQGYILSAISSAIAIGNDYISYSGKDIDPSWDFPVSDWISKEEEKEIDNIIFWDDFDKNMDYTASKIFNLLTKNLTVKDLSKSLQVA